MTVDTSPDLLGLTTEIVGKYVANNLIPPDQIASLIEMTFIALAGLGQEPAPPEVPKPEPAVSIRASVKPDYLISLESGRKLKMLKRYLLSTYGMTPDDYRRKWGLPADYPMVAPNYSTQRRDLANRIGLGRRSTHDQPVAEQAKPAPRAKPRR